MSQLALHPGGKSSIASAVLGFPFRTEFSLAPLIRFWEHEIAAGASVFAPAARTVLDQVQQAPELTGPQVDPAAIAAHMDVIHALMTAVFAPTFQDEEHAAALLPFRLQSFYATPGFKRLLAGPDGALQFRMDADIALVLQVRILNAYSLILERVYGFDLGIEFPWVAVIKDPDTGLDRHFKLITSRRFLDVDVVGEAPALSDADLRGLRAHAADPAVLMRLLPADRFVIRGFSVVRAIEVTEPEVLSAIERELIDKESIVSTERFRELQDKLRALFRRPELELGLAAIDGDRVLTLQFGTRFEHACIFADSMKHKLADFAGSIHERAAREGRPIIVEDLQNYPDRTHVEEKLLAAGYRSVVVAPLFYQGELIGSLKLVSPTPGALNVTHTPQLAQIMPLFAMAVKRSMDELNNRVQAVIKQRCTAIHPVVEWRFRQAVLGMLEREAGSDASSEMEPIVFRDVHPLYALSDIRGSSNHRVWSIQGDLLAQLGLAREVLEAAHRVRPMPILDQIRHRIATHADAVEVRMGAGDEAGVVAFLRREVETLFEHLESYGEEVRERIEAYRGALDPQLGAVGKRRRAFEETVGLINETILAYLEAEEASAQTLSPHFFEMQRTDGVDYSIYAGNTLLEDGGFAPLHLKNLRLWQLIVACGIAVHVERVKPRMAEPLEITNLILVQHAPLAIRFRFDEKRFDVDGAYNVRYEILKKRIDKAVLRGSTERLTQPGKIAIVYSQSSEAAEYRDYIAYLQAQGYLSGEVENLDLEELQGVPGLRALRVAVDFGRARIEPTAPVLAAARAALSSPA
jgi:GAF domain-containing protein